MTEKKYLCEEELDGITCGGELEQIARTKRQADMTELAQTTFFACNYCNQIYRRFEGMRLGFDIRTKELIPKIYFDLLPYEGSLTREQVIEHVPNRFGFLSEEKERRIISKEQ